MEKIKETTLDSFNKPFAKALRDLLDGIGSPLDRKVSQKELADKVGVSRQVISQYCNGVTSPNVETLKSIAEFFNVSSDFLIGLTSIPTTNTEDRAIHDKTGLSDAAIMVLKKNKTLIDQIYEGKDGQLPNELQSVNMIIEEMEYVDNFIELFTKYRLFQPQKGENKVYVTDNKGNVTNIHYSKDTDGNLYHNAEDFPFKASMLENMFLMAIQDSIKSMKKND